jgi:superfamily II DNA/RNA helicase
MHAEDYVHRIGRTGRAGMSGRALTIATPDDTKFVNQIEQLIGNAIPRIELEGFAVEPREEGDGKRRRGGTRGDRSRSRAPAPRAAAAAAETQPERAERTERAPRERSGGRRSARPEPRTHEVVAAVRSEAPRPRRRAQDDSHDAPVVGFGDDVPAFLRAPRRVAKTA